MDTIDELEWCLEQLETVQTHRSVSDMASLKVSILYNRIQCVIQFNLSNSLIFEINFVLSSFIHPFLCFFFYSFSLFNIIVFEQSATFFTFSITIIDVVVNLVIIFILLLPVLLNTSQYIFFILTHTHTNTKTHQYLVQTYAE